MENYDITMLIIDELSKDYSNFKLQFRSDIPNLNTHVQKLRILGGYEVKELHRYEYKDKDHLRIYVREDTLTLASDRHLRLGENGNCAHLFQAKQFKSIDFTGLDTSNITNMYRMFARFVAEDINFSTFDTSNVTNMKEAFDFLIVGHLDISNFDMSKVTNAERMFSLCQTDYIKFNDNLKLNKHINVNQMFRDGFSKPITNNEIILNAYANREG